MVPYDSFGLQRVYRVRQLELDSHPLSQLKFRRQHCSHAAFAEIEGPARNAGWRAGTKHGDVDGNRHGITRNAATNSAEARCRVSRSGHISG